MKRVFSLVILSIIIACSLMLSGCSKPQTDHTHAFGEWKTVKEATCTEDGSKIRACECGEIEAETILAKGHTEEIIAEKPATCTESGLTEGKKCSTCGEIIVNQEEIPAINHIYKYTEKTDENGATVTTSICQRENCGHTLTSAAGLYDAEDNLIASWADLVNNYGLDVKANYSNGDYDNKKTHITYILNNNEELNGAKKLIIDDGVTQIGRLAFENCATLTNIKLPNTLTIMSSDAFNYCESLKSIIIPEGVKCDTYELFQYCTSLEYIYLPASTLDVVYYFESFIGCFSLKNIEISEESLNFKTIDGSLYSKDGKGLIKYATGKEDKEFILPEGVIEICEGAFSYSSYLETIYLHNNITTIYGRPFSNSLSINDVYYNGTEEEWEALNIHVINYSNNVVIHYDGIDRFKTSRFAGYYESSGVSGTNHVSISKNEVYIYNFNEKVLYTDITKNNDLKIECADSIYKGIEPERLPIIEQIKTCGEWYVLNGINGEGSTETRIVCYIDGAIYVLIVVEMNEETNTATVNQITYAIVDLEDYYEK